MTKKRIKIAQKRKITKASVTGGSNLEKLAKIIISFGNFSFISMHRAKTDKICSSMYTVKK